VVIEILTLDAAEWEVQVNLIFIFGVLSEVVIQVVLVVRILLHRMEQSNLILLVWSKR
jgi:hypothetical protein